VPEIAPDQLSALAARDWPGNVRELRNAAERFVLGLGLGVSPASASGVSGSVSGPGNGSILRDPAASRATETLADHMMSYEKSLISAAIAAHDGRLKETYEALGLSRKTLYEKMQRHGLTREDFLPDPQRR